MAPQGHQIPKASDLQAFDHAVAGHAGTLCDATGSLFIKPCVQAEIDFYETVNRDHPNLAEIIPLYIGSLKLQETDNPVEAVEQIKQAASQSAAAAAPTKPEPPKDNIKWVQNGSGSIKTDRAIVLENAIHGFKHPNILDVKLGTQLCTDSAAEEKKARMKVIAEQTTHKNFGFRIAGMRMWNGHEYTVYDKDYGRKEVNDSNIVDALKKFLFANTGSVDEEHGRAIAVAFKADLENVRDVLEKERTRMFSSSLLFVFEGDGDALKSAIEANGRAAAAAAESEAEDEAILIREQQEQAPPTKRRRMQSPVSVPVPAPIHVEPEALYHEQPEDKKDKALRASSRRVVLGKAADRSSSRTDSGIEIDDDDEEDGIDIKGLHMVPESFDMADEADDASVTDSDASESESDVPPIYSLRLIDFAHAKFVNEDTPDENNLMGVRKLIEIFDKLCA